MIAHLGTNRAGRPCCVFLDGTHDAFDTVKEAADAVRRANAEVRVQAKREAQHMARMSLGALAMRLRVGLAILPEILNSSRDIACKREFVRG